jgi:hypothetical protein
MKKKSKKKIIKNDTIDRLKLEDWRAEQVIKWIKTGEKPAVLSFTSGNERFICYAVEDRMDVIFAEILKAAGIRKKLRPRNKLYSYLDSFEELKILLKNRKKL